MAYAAAAAAAAVDNYYLCRLTVAADAGDGREIRQAIAAEHRAAGPAESRL